MRYVEGKTKDVYTRGEGRELAMFDTLRMRSRGGGPTSYFVSSSFMTRLC